MSNLPITERDSFRCVAIPSPRSSKNWHCYFNTQPNSSYCPGHQGDPYQVVDLKALAVYQAKHGVDYPCGKPDDLHRIFDPEDYNVVVGGEATQADPPLGNIGKRSEDLRRAMEGLKAGDPNVFQVAADWEDE